MRTLLAILSLAAAARANDGFFWGAGETLRPIHNKSLRVLRETLELSPIERPTCYHVLYKGRPRQPPDDYDYRSPDFATIGPRAECAALKNAWAKFSPAWTAEAVYEISALADAADVVLGFPVHGWSADFYTPDGLNGISAPGVAAFETFIDGTPVPSPELKWLEGVGENGDRKTLGYAWKASFQKNRRYTLRTRYQFGVDVSNAFYEGREYAKGEKPWFHTEGSWSEASRVIYYLTPLRQWAAPPPSRVSIVVTLPPGLPMVAAVPIKPKPRCVGERSLFYELRDSFPAQDLELSYPSGKTLPGRLKTPADWDAWMKTLGGPDIEMNCALLTRLKADAAPALRDILAARKCRPSCR